MCCCLLVLFCDVGCPGAVDSCPNDGLGNDMTNNFMVYIYLIQFIKTLLFEIFILNILYCVVCTGLY
jgi:hypothetical protein